MSLTAGPSLRLRSSLYFDHRMTREEKKRAEALRRKANELGAERRALSGGPKVTQIHFAYNPWSD